MSNKVFVFVVCGKAEHIETLHLSLKYLKKYSKNNIVVITDTSRNDLEISHPQIINIETPKHYSHHQASIYLKTGIHKFLPKGNLYCYLDTDVVAVSEKCDEIFEEFKTPIRFAPDHCKVRKFSSSAVNCDCQKNREIDRQKFFQFTKDINSITVTNPILIEKGKELQFEFDQLKKSLPKKIYTAIRFFLSPQIFHFNNQFYFNKKTKTWHIKNGDVVMYDVDVDKMQKATGLVYNKWTKKWYNKQGEDIWYDECNHLTEYIEDTFQINIKDKNWQHWNGGVFLFDDSSHNFLDAWHNKTMYIFTLPNWKVRDQGTLIATAWEFGLANHPTLSKRFNFIADYNNNGVQINTETNHITDDGFITKYEPAFVHVYHHWGNKSWPIWQWIETKF
jgi:hypothetical protein